MSTAQYTPVGLELPEELDIDDWIDVGRPIIRTHESMMWWIGDWLLYAEAHYQSPEDYEQVKRAIAGTDLAAQTVKNARWVADRIPRHRRHEGVPWRHHQLVAALPEEDADALLEEAARDGLSQREMGQAVNRLTGADDTDDDDVPEADEVLLSLLRQAIEDLVEPEELLRRLDEAGYRVTLVRRLRAAS